MLVNSAGDQEELACFERDENTQAHRSCSLNWRNQFHIFGGGIEKRQISRLTGYKLERVGDLAFDHDFAACTVMSNEYIFLCFHQSVSDYKRCRRSTGPLENFADVALSKHPHRRAQTPCYDNVLVAVGSLNPSTKKAEKYEDGDWSDLQEPPVDVSLYSYAVIVYEDNFFYFGGWDTGRGRSEVSLILCLNAASWAWTNVGQMNSIRYGHGVIQANDTFMVIGGYATHPNEACILRNGNFTCEQKSSGLTDYAHTPLLFLVDDSYGNC